MFEGFGRVLSFYNTTQTIEKRIGNQLQGAYQSISYTLICILFMMRRYHVFTLC